MGSKTRAKFLEYQSWYDWCDNAMEGVEKQDQGGKDSPDRFLARNRIGKGLDNHKKVAVQGHKERKDNWAK